MAFAAASSLRSACTLASVKFFAPSFTPILVSALPSAPWHLAQSVSQFSLASAPLVERVAAKPNIVASRSIFFIVISPVDLLPDAVAPGSKTISANTKKPANHRLFNTWHFLRHRENRRRNQGQN